MRIDPGGALQERKGFIVSMFVSDLYHHVYIVKLWRISCFNRGHGHGDYVVVSCTYDTEPAVTVNNH